MIRGGKGVRVWVGIDECSCLPVMMTRVKNN